MSSENCKPRQFSWLVKSCLPNPDHHHHLQPQPLTVVTTTTISSLPDDLILECLSRVSQSSLSALSSVCRRWSFCLASVQFSNLRRLHGLLRPSIYAISVSEPYLFTAHLRVGDKNSNDDGCDGASSWNIASVSLEYDFFRASFSQARVVAIGHRIYILDRSFTLRFDIWTGTFSLRSTMPFPRKKFAVTVISSKIFITGGVSRTSTIEEYDPETDEWRVVTHAPRRRYGCIGASVDGIFYIIGGLKINSLTNEEPSRAAGMEAYAYASSMDLYDVEANNWLRSRAIPGGGCVVAACAAGGNVYVLTSHAVEMSFWRFSARKTSTEFGEWCRIKSPPLPAQVRVDSTVRFSCVGIGEGKVGLVQVNGCIDDLLRRSGRSVRGLKEGLVMVYDAVAGEWSRVADLPEVIRRPACVCVEC